MAKAVILKGEVIRKEGVAGGAITPGHLVQGFGSSIVVHATAGGDARRTFALINDLVGDDIDDAYDSGDTVQYGVFEQGAEVNALLAASQTIVAGDALVSNGDGTLKKHDESVDTSSTTVDVYVEAIVGYATEAKTTTTSTTRIAVEVA